MPAVDAAHGEVLVLAVEEVSDVVQERRHDEGIGRALALGQLGRLERVLLLRDRLAVIGRRAPRGEQLQDLLDDLHQATPSCTSTSDAGPMAGFDDRN